MSVEAATARTIGFLRAIRGGPAGRPSPPSALPSNPGASFLRHPSHLPFLFAPFAPFPRGRGEARWALTEPFPRDKKYRLRTGRLKPGDRLRVRSLNDSDGFVSVDCLRDAAFPFGSVAEFSLSREPLRVLGV